MSPVSSTLDDAGIYGFNLKLVRSTIDSIAEWLKALGPVAGTGIVFIILGLGLVIHEVEGRTPKPISAEDRKALGEIWAAFSRQAFDDLNWAEIKQIEDLRAMFSAFNETRISVQTNRAKVSNRVLKNLLAQMDKDFRAVQMLSPWNPNETDIKPDRGRLQSDGDHQHVADWMHLSNDNNVKDILKRRPNDPYFALYFELKERRSRILKTKDLIEHIVTNGFLGDMRCVGENT